MDYNFSNQKPHSQKLYFIVVQTGNLLPETRNTLTASVPTVIIFNSVFKEQYTTHVSLISDYTDSLSRLTQ